jgi:hypothetical protein
VRRKPHRARPRRDFLLLSRNWEAPRTAAPDNRMIVDRRVHPGVQNDPLSCRFAPPPDEGKPADDRPRGDRDRGQSRDRGGDRTGAGAAGARRALRLLPGHRSRRARIPAGLPRQPHQQRRVRPGGDHLDGGRAIAMEADLSDPATPASLFDLAEQQLGPVDILVSNATGWLADSFAAAHSDRLGRSLEPVTAAGWTRQFSVDAMAPTQPSIRRSWAGRAPRRRRPPCAGRP